MIARTSQPLPVPAGTFIEFELPRPVASSKNRRRIFARGRRVVSLPSAQAVSDVEMVRQAALGATAVCGTRFGPDDALCLDYWHDVAADTVRVRVTKVGTLPQKGRRGTKRDLHGMVETIADALQGVLFPNDNQVDEVAMRRVRRVSARLDGNKVEL